MFPYAIWKQNIYEYPFYNFLLNPFPLNIPGYLEVYLSSKNYVIENFPLSIFIPLSLSDLTNFLGVGCFLLFFLLFNKFNKKNIFLFITLSFIFIYSYLGQKTPRFYLEIYLFVVLIGSIIIRDIKNTFSFKLLKSAVIFQSIYLICVLIIGNISLLPGIFSETLNKKVLSKHAYGYNIYSWANSVLPNNSILINA